MQSFADIITKKVSNKNFLVSFRKLSNKKCFQNI